MKKILATAMIIIAFFSTGCATTTGAAAFQDKSAKEIYESGSKEVKKSQYKSAISHFEALDALYPFSPYTEQSQLQIIYAYFQSQDWASAVAAADRYIHLYPRGKNVDYAYYIKGMSNMQRERSWIYRFFPVSSSQRDLVGMEEAFNDFSQLIYVFPKSEYAEDSRKRMIFIRDLLAKNEINVAEFYFARKAYVASANRASYVVRHFEESRHVKPALKLMVKSYKALGKKELAADAEKVLKNTFSKSNA